MNNSAEYGDIGTEKHKIASYQMDLKGQATLPVINNLFQEIAGNHAAANGFGFPQMFKTGHMWVLTRMKTEVERYPKWNEDIYVKTWVKSREHIISERAFLLLDKNKNKLAGALSGWMLLDLKSKRPKNLENLEIKVKMFPNEKTIETSLKKITSVDHADFVFEKKVLFDDIDVNQHVNNVKYTEWILAGFPFEFRRTHNIKSLEINYSSELISGEKANIQTQKISGDTFLCSVINKSNRKEVCRAELVWTSIK